MPEAAPTETPHHIKWIERSDDATIPSGDSSVTVSHELVDTPDAITVTGGDAEVASLWVESVGPDEFTIHTNESVSSDCTVYWEASVSMGDLDPW